MSRPTIALTLLSGLLLGACSTFDVHGPDGDLDGVPFFAKRGVLRQTTVETRTWMEVVLLREAIDSTGNQTTEGKTLLVDESSWDAARIDALSANQDLANKPLAKAIEWFSKPTDQGGGGLVLLDPSTVATLTEPKAAVPAGSGVIVRQISNTTALAHEVDYTRPLHFNVEAPWFGTAEGTFALNADGSLSEGSSKVDATGLGEELPLTEYLLDSLGLAGANLADNGMKPQPRLIVQARRTGYRYTYRRTWIPGVDKGISLDTRVRERLTAADADSVERTALGGSGGSKPDKDAVTFSGSVKLPEG